MATSPAWCLAFWISPRWVAENALRDERSAFRHAVDGQHLDNNARNAWRSKRIGEHFTGQDRASYEGFRLDTAVLKMRSPTVDAWNQAVADKKKMFVFEEHQFAARRAKVAPIGKYQFGGGGEITEWVGVHSGHH
jgi:hypothetical protein